ncbi:MAG: tetratricopeptide repeat protein [Verrucomicrobiota bacterium]|nr:tetratricopeptide repeat protein [Verrucomicrobiota bacterium]
MKNKKAFLVTGCLLATLLMFIGCGERAGEKEYGKAMAAWKAGELVQAQSLLEKSIRKTSGNEKKSIAWNQLGLILWNLGKTAEAAEAFNESCVLSESLTGANLNLGIALFHANRFDEAEVALNNVIGENAKNQTALAMLGLISAQKQDWTDASKALAEAVKANPQNPAGQNALALAELQHNSNTAIQRLKQLVSAYPDYAPAAYNLAVIHEQKLGSKSAALDWYRQYLQRAGTDGSHVAAATQAIARLDATPATKSNPDAAKGYMTEGSALLAAKKFNAAISQFEQAIETDPSQKFAHYNLGYAYFNLDKHNEAAKAFVSALKLDPRYADARYMLSYSYFQLRKWKDAEREAKELVKVDKVRGEQMLNYIRKR